MSDDDIRAPHLRRSDFLGAFGLLRRDDRILLVRNERVIRGVPTSTWDLPGGQVEPGELLDEALRRELDEEIGVRVHGATPFLFYQEGERVEGGRRRHAWRSFFFAVQAWEGEPQPRNEIRELRWFREQELRANLTAPYHDSFVVWLERGGSAHRSEWVD